MTVQHESGNKKRIAVVAMRGEKKYNIAVSATNELGELTSRNYVVYAFDQQLAISEALHRAKAWHNLRAVHLVSCVESRIATEQVKTSKSLRAKRHSFLIAAYKHRTSWHGWRIE